MADKDNNQAGDGEQQKPKLKLSLKKKDGQAAESTHAEANQAPASPPDDSTQTPPSKGSGLKLSLKKPADTPPGEKKASPPDSSGSHEKEPEQPASSEGRKPLKLGIKPPSASKEASPAEEPGKAAADEPSSQASLQDDDSVAGQQPDTPAGSGTQKQAEEPPKAQDKATPPPPPPPPPPPAARGTRRESSKEESAGKGKEVSEEEKPSAKDKPVEKLPRAEHIPELRDEFIQDAVKLLRGVKQPTSTMLQRRLRMPKKRSESLFKTINRYRLLDKTDTELAIIFGSAGNPASPRPGIAPRPDKEQDKPARAAHKPGMPSSKGKPPPPPPPAKTKEAKPAAAPTTKPVPPVPKARPSGDTVPQMPVPKARPTGDTAPQMPVPKTRPAFPKPATRPPIPQTGATPTAKPTKPKPPPPRKRTPAEKALRLANLFCVAVILASTAAIAASVILIKPPETMEPDSAGGTTGPQVAVAGGDEPLLVAASGTEAPAPVESPETLPEGVVRDTWQFLADLDIILSDGSHAPPFIVIAGNIAYTVGATLEPNLGLVVEAINADTGQVQFRNDAGWRFYKQLR